MSIKDQILTILVKNKGTDISGNKIACEIGITRSAVWKSIKQLQKEGYQISGTTNRGYCLSAESDIISEQAIRQTLKTKSLGNSILIMKTVDSTNNYAKNLIQQGIGHGTVVISEIQTMGKGRLERNFYSPGKTGIYMSIILRPQNHLLSMNTASLITSCAAVSIAKAIDNISGLETKIKWVNDIYANGKKLVGILTEAGMNFENCMLDYAIVGIGINALTLKFPEELKKVATSIRIESGKPFSRSELIAEVLNIFEEYFDKIETKSFLPEYINRSNIIGKDIMIIGGGKSYPATAIGIDENAKLIIKTLDGHTHVLNSGEISVRAKEY